MNDNRRAPNIQRFLDSFANAVGMSDQTRADLEGGSNHPYQCRCDMCLRWWAHMGGEDMGDGRLTYGPFTEAEVQTKQRELGLLDE